MRPYEQSPPVVVVPKARPENVTEGAGRCPMRTLAVAAALFLLLAGCGGDDKPTAESTSKATSTSQATTARPERASIRGHLYFTRTTASDVQTVFAASGLQERQLTEPGEACCILRKSPTHGRLLVMPGGDIDTHHRRHHQPQRRQLHPARGSPTPPSTWCHRPGPRRRRGSPSRGGRRRSAPDRHLHRACRGWNRPRPRHQPARTVPRRPARLLTGRHAARLYRSTHADPDPHTDGSLWVVNVDGSGAHRVTTAESPQRTGPMVTGCDANPVRERTAVPTGPIWTVSPTGTGLTKLFEDKNGGFAIAPEWSADGTRMSSASTQER